MGEEPIFCPHRIPILFTKVLLKFIYSRFSIKYGYVPLYLIAPPISALFCKKIEFYTWKSAFYANMAPPHAKATLFSKYESVINKFYGFY